MGYQKGSLIYDGKAKKLYEVPGYPELVWQEFKDSMTAFNGQKKVDFEGKGQVNRNICTAIFRFLKKKGIKSHWVQSSGARDMVTEKLKMIPLEVVVRNKVAGSLAKRLRLQEKASLTPPVVEFFYKDDGLGDPFINDEHALLLKAVTSEKELKKLKEIALQINTELKAFFGETGLDLIDFKLEFGKNGVGEIILSDEISPDSCRLWDFKTGERKDKDRFRMDLGGVIESYKDIEIRIRTHWPDFV
jgi:phosphoribosylaminoimidazole-succinocarboxamide synthase